jgi:hypothetical protein
MNPRVVIAPERLKAIHADYERLGTIKRAAAKHGVYVKTLSDHFHAAGLPIHNRKPKPKMREPKDKVAAMHRLYMTGATLREVGEKFGGHSNGAVRNMFRIRGLFLREGNPGCYQPGPRKTDVEIEAMIAKATRIAVPHELHNEWRDYWPMERRIWFLNRLRAKLKSPKDRPARPFSSNVEPFDYSSARAHAICAEKNKGRSSREANVKLRIVSQGVIYKGELYFWQSNFPQAGGAYYTGPWRPDVGRPALHHLIWEEFNGPVPPHHVVRMRDNNPNNLDPANLYLQSRGDEASENRRAIRIKQSREKTALLLQRFEAKEKQHGNHNDEPLRQLVASRAARDREKTKLHGKTRRARRDGAAIQGA